MYFEVKGVEVEVKGMYFEVKRWRLRRCSLRSNRAEVEVEGVQFVC